MSALSDVDRRVAAALRRAGDSVIGNTLVVAVSGGPDSVALLRSLERLSSPFELHLHVAHLDHDFRGEEAVEDARFVAALAGELDYPAPSRSKTRPSTKPDARSPLSSNSPGKCGTHFLLPPPAGLARPSWLWATLQTIKRKPYCCTFFAAPASMGFAA